MNEPPEITTNGVLVRDSYSDSPMKPTTEVIVLALRLINTPFPDGYPPSHGLKRVLALELLQLSN